MLTTCDGSIVQLLWYSVINSIQKLYGYEKLQKTADIPFTIQKCFDPRRSMPGHCIGYQLSRTTLYKKASGCGHGGQKHGLDE